MFQAQAGTVGTPGLPALSDQGIPVRRRTNRQRQQAMASNEYVDTTRRRGRGDRAGPGSGKMATCLSQLYHDHLRGTTSGYAKFETFPIWNLPLDHPVNVAYEAATADLDDVNMIDPLPPVRPTASRWSTTTATSRSSRCSTSYSSGCLGHSPYKSPTDMGVNMVGYLHQRRRGVPAGVQTGSDPAVLQGAGSRAPRRARTRPCPTESRC